MTLSALFHRATRLMAEHKLRLVFVFDGKPPALKAEEVARRRAVKQRYDEEHATVQAPSEGEAQAAYMAATSPDVWAAASKDYDSLLFGAPPIVPETIELDRLLHLWGIDREAPVDLGILVGTGAEPDMDGIVRFLCDEREFSRDRVNAAIERTFRERSLW